MDKAKKLIPTIAESYYGKLAKFLETNNQKQMAFDLTPDLDDKFQPAIWLNNVEVGNSIAEEQ